MKTILTTTLAFALLAPGLSAADKKNSNTRSTKTSTSFSTVGSASLSQKYPTTYEPSSTSPKARASGSGRRSRIRLP